MRRSYYTIGFLSIPVWGKFIFGRKLHINKVRIGGVRAVVTPVRCDEMKNVQNSGQNRNYI